MSPSPLEGVRTNAGIFLVQRNPHPMHLAPAGSCGTVMVPQTGSKTEPGGNVGRRIQTHRVPGLLSDRLRTPKHTQAYLSVTPGGFSNLCQSKLTEIIKSEKSTCLEKIQMVPRNKDREYSLASRSAVPEGRARDEMTSDEPSTCAV